MNRGRSSKMSGRRTDAEIATPDIRYLGVANDIFAPPRHVSGFYETLNRRTCVFVDRLCTRFTDIRSRV